MNQQIADQLLDNDAGVSAICHIGYMSSGEVSESLEEIIDEYRDTPSFSSVLGLSAQEQAWLDEALDAEETVQMLIDIGKTGFLIKLSGKIYEQHPTMPNCASFTGFSTSELAYAHTAADINQAILGAMERLNPRLWRAAKTQGS